VETVYSPGDDVEWIGQKKYVYTYPPGNNFNISTKKAYVFNWWETQEWENFDSIAITYHPVSGLIESEIRSTWKAQEEKWIFASKDDYVYDENNNLINYQQIRWSLIKSDWESWKEEESYFNSSNLSAEYIVKPFWYEWRSMIDEYKARTWEFDKWRENNHTLFYYSPLDATSVIPVVNEKFRVYPNRSREYVFIDISESQTQVVFELYDLAGRKTIFRNLAGSAQVSLLGLPEGLYMYNIIVSGQGKFSGKLLITK